MRHHNLVAQDVLDGNFMNALIKAYWDEIPIIDIDVYVKQDAYWRLLKDANEQHRNLVQKFATSQSFLIHGINYVEAEFKGDTEANMYGIITHRVCKNVITFFNDGSAAVEKVNKPNQLKFTANVIFE